MSIAYTIETLTHGAVILNVHGTPVAAADDVQDLLPKKTVKTADLAADLMKVTKNDKIPSVRILRKVTGLGLKEAKEIVEANATTLHEPDPREWLEDRGYKIGTPWDFAEDPRTDDRAPRGQFLVYDPRPNGAIFEGFSPKVAIDEAYARLNQCTGSL